MSSAGGDTLKKCEEKSGHLTDLTLEGSPDFYVQVNTGALEEEEEEEVGDGQFASIAEETKAEIDGPVD